MITQEQALDAFAHDHGATRIWYATKEGLYFSPVSPDDCTTFTRNSLGRLDLGITPPRLAFSSDLTGDKEDVSLAVVIDGPSKSMLEKQHGVLLLVAAGQPASKDFGTTLDFKK